MDKGVTASQQVDSVRHSVGKGGEEMDRASTTSQAGLTVEEVVGVVGEQFWVWQSCQGLLEGWAAEVELEFGEVAAWLMSTGRHIGQHAKLLQELMPDSVLLDEVRDAAIANPQQAESLEAIKEIAGTPNRLAVAADLLLPSLIETCDALTQKCSPHADASLNRTLGLFSFDIGNDLAKGRALLAQLIGPSTKAETRQARAMAVKHLAAWPILQSPP